MKRFIAILLVFILAFSLSVSSFADTGTNATITLNNPNSNITIVGKTFSAYCLFDLNYKVADGAFAYTVNDDFEGFFRDLLHMTDVSSYNKASLDAAAYAHVNALTPNSKALLDFADAAYNWAKDSTHPISAVTHEDASGESVTLDVGAFGYYLVYGEALDGNDNIVVSDYMCVTCNSDDVATAVNLKADAPTVDKDVATEDSLDNSTYNDLAVDAGLGDTVYFMYTSTVPDMYGYDEYTFTFNDTLSEGLTFGSISSVTVGSTTVNVGTGDDTYTFTKTENLDDTTTLTLALNNFLNYTEGDAIVVKYTATVNAAGLTVSENTVDITYSNDPNDSTTNHTPGSTVHVYNYQFPVYKYTLDSEEEEQELAGAKFNLYRVNEDSSTTLLYFVDETYYRLPDATETTGLTETLVSGDDGMISIRGLDAGTYILEETLAPEGYNLLTDTITVTIAAVTDTTTGEPTGDCTITSKFTGSDDPASTVTQISVQNTTGVELPSTGGIGTTMFTIGGLAILFLAGAFLVVNRKKIFGK